MIYKKYLWLAILTCLFSACAKKDDASSASAGQAYSFSASANGRVSLVGSVAMEAISIIKDDLLFENLIRFNNPNDDHRFGELTTTTGPTLCSSVVCFSATALTGKYYGTGFSIQSAGHGMVAYFGQNSWSGITGTSTAYPFDASYPIVNSGTLTCCNGTGDFTSSNTYIESVMYLFSYLDATFTVTNVTGNTTMNQAFTLRFVFADGAIPSGIRGDLLIKDLGLPNGQGGQNDGAFKWVSSSSGTLSLTRPTDPVTMNSSVTNYTNPFGVQAGNQTIPVIYAGVYPASGSGLFTFTEAELKTEGRTYNYKFDPTNFIMFPDLIAGGQDINSISSLKGLMSHVHLGGLPYSLQTRGVGNPASTVLTVTSP